MQRAVITLGSHLIVTLALSLAVAGRGETAPARIATVEAGQHVNEEAMVCGRVAGTKYAVKTRRQPTFLDFDKPYPQEVFQVVIWGPDRAKFREPPESTYNQKRVCVTGRITLYRGTPEIIVRDPSQLMLDQPGR